MPDDIEDHIKLVCTLNWPARNQAGTFQKTIGRPVESASRYQLPAFPISLLRDADAFEAFCRTDLSDVQAEISEPWEFWYEVECYNTTLRRALPGLILPVTFGPFPAELITNPFEEFRQAADIMWTSQLQTHQVEGVHLFRDTGMVQSAFQDIYAWFWGIKDEGELELSATDAQLRAEYIRLASRKLAAGDEEAAAQYSKIAYDLSATEDAADEVWASFTPLVERWGRFAAANENAIKRIATAAREGNAEWNTIVSERYVRDGLITPITEEVNSMYSSNELETRRQRIRALSATHPYRRGLEHMESIEASMGFSTVSLAGMLTEFPLEELRRRVPASVIEGIKRDSPWSPDTRIQRSAELSPSDVPRITFTGEVMPYMQTIHAHLDSDLPGILSHALDQVPYH
jgi:hypothetical protein